MKKWSAAVDHQRKECGEQAQGSAADASPPEFTWMQTQTAMLPNPYAQQDDDDDDLPPHMQSSNSPYQQQSAFGMNRNASSTSLRSRSTTGESSQSLAGMVRQPPPRFPMVAQNPPLSLQTQMPQGPSPGLRGGDSYFSPVAESPASSRTSQNSMYPFPRQGTPQGGWEEHNRYTAPALARAPSRESQTSMNTYNMNGRNPQRPSLPVMSSQQGPVNTLNRSRSYSTPDINGTVGTQRRTPVPAVPGIPPHLHPAYDNGIPRSSNSSPINNGLPIRSNTQSPGVQRERLAQQQYAQQPPPYNRSNTTQIPMSRMDDRTISAPLGTSTGAIGELPLPTSFKVKVNVDGNYVTLVVPFNITYQSLIDRIDAKVGRFSNNAISRGTMRLRYQDEDGDFVTIESDDDLYLAIQEWREAQRQGFQGQFGEIELFCASVEN
jgi:cell division control protein 24